MYAIDALAGDPRANAHYMELHKEDVARRATARASAKEYSCAVCAWIEYVNLPGAVVQLFSQSPHLHAQGELHPLAQSSFIPTFPPSIRASRAIDS